MILASWIIAAMRHLRKASWPNFNTRHIINSNIWFRLQTNFGRFLRVFLIALPLTSSGQKQANIWFFGRNSGLDFRSAAPTTLLNGQINTEEGCSSVCDSEGNLLFYTDGVTVWNRHHQIMDNGRNLWGSYTATQTLIVPKPGNEQIFYIFTTSPQYDYVFGEDADSVGFHYTVVDLSPDLGLGAVVTKNQLLFKNTTEKVTAVHHSNGSDIWVVAHEWNSNVFRAYLITESGISSTPILSAVGQPHNDIGEEFQVVHLHAIGQMKFTSNGSKIATAIYQKNLIEVFEFDSSTGQFAIPFVSIEGHTIDPADFYGLEFSPSGASLFYTQKLHCGNNEHLSKLFQYIFETKETLLVGEFLGSLNAMQLAPDGKIYVALCNDIAGQSNFMGVINYPERRGLACEFTTDQVDLQSGKNYLGLPNFVQSWFRFPDPVLEMPNVFTPNGDSLNASFIPKRFENIIAAEMKIFNRWGEEIFCTNDLHTGWNGASTSPGVYYWTVRYEGKNGKNGQQKGWVSLIY